MYPKTCLLFSSTGKLEASILDKDAARMVRRKIAELVYEFGEIIGVMRLQTWAQRQEAELELPNYRGPKKFHRKQDLGGYWCWQIMYPDGRVAA